MPKNVQTTTHLHSSHMLAKKCSKFSKWGFNSMWTVNFQMCKLDLKWEKNQRFNCQYLLDHQKAREFQKNIYFCLSDYTKAFHCVDHNKLCKIPKEWEYQTTLPASWDICMQVKKLQLELAMEQQTISRSGKEYIKAVYCHTAYWTAMQSTSWEMLDWMKHKLESRLPGEISITSYMQMIPHLWQKGKN